MVSFFRHFSGFSFFNHSLFTAVSKASFVLLARNLVHYMAESCGSLFNSHKKEQGLYGEYGNECATDIMVFCSDALKGESSTETYTASF